MSQPAPSKKFFVNQPEKSHFKNETCTD